MGLSFAGTKPEKGQLARFVVSSLAGFAMMAPALAKSPPDAGLLLKQQEQLQIRLPDSQQQPEAPEPARPSPEDDTGITVRVQSIHFNGALDMVPEAQLQELVRGVIGDELDFAGLQELTIRVSNYLRDNGHLLARAYLTPQDVTEGHLEITLQKGRLAGAPGKGGGWQINTAPGVRIDAARLQDIVESAAPSGSSATQNDLERALLLINDLPGVTAHATLGPGVASGTSKLTVEASEGPLFGVMLQGDNFGNQSTGKAQTSAQVNLNDFSGQGDHAGLLLTESAGISLGRLSYDLPLGSQGLRGAINYLDMRYKVVEGLGVASKLAGTSQIIDLDLTYPFIRSRTQNLAGRLGIARKSISDNSAAGSLDDKLINVISVQLSGNVLPGLTGNRQISGGIAISAGRLDLGADPANQAADAASLHTQGDYLKASYQLTAQQNLGSKVTLAGRVSGQVAGKNLDSSEKFILGGPNGVRAYPAAEAPGDEGWLASLEIRYDLPGATHWGDVRLFSFIDTGGITLHKDAGNMAIGTYTGRNRFNLAGAGLGATLSRAENYSVNIVWAFPWGNNPGRSSAGLNTDGRQDASRFWLQASVGL